MISKLDLTYSPVHQTGCEDEIHSGEAISICAGSLRTCLSLDAAKDDSQRTGLWTHLSVGAIQHQACLHPASEGYHSHAGQAGPRNASTASNVTSSSGSQDVPWQNTVRHAFQTQMMLHYLRERCYSSKARKGSKKSRLAEVTPSAANILQPEHQQEAPSQTALLAQEREKHVASRPMAVTSPHAGHSNLHSGAGARQEGPMAVQMMLSPEQIYSQVHLCNRHDIVPAIAGLHLSEKVHCMVHVQCRAAFPIPKCPAES